MIRIDIDTRELERNLTDIQKKQVPFALSRALNATANDAKEAEAKAVQTHLDRPTPFTINGFAVKRSNKRNLVSIMYIKPRQAEYLKYQIDGGERKAKGAGHALPTNIRLNKYGNLTGRRDGKRIDKLLSNPKNFRGVIGGTEGIWQRKRNGGVKLLISFRETAKYESIFPFYETAKTTISKVINQHFIRELELAISNSKG